MIEMKKINVLVVVILLATGVVSAQFTQSMFNSPNQQLVEQAVRNGVVLLRQDYQLLDTVTNERYGWNHRDMFNSVYSVGIKVGDGYVVSDRFVHPWSYDGRYLDLTGVTYVPVVSKTMGRIITDTVMTEIKYGVSDVCPLEDSLAYRIDCEDSELEGFTVDSSAGAKDGWLVWVVAKDSTLSDSSDLSLVTYRYSMTIDDDTLSYQLPDPVASDYIVGGFYVVPQNTSVGKLDFKLVGFAALRDSLWYLVVENFTDEHSAEVDTEGVSMLTPVVAEDDSVNDGNSASSRRGQRKRR